MPTERLALFIGAGFSYELGMPLVWELTNELGDWLTGDKLRELNRGWVKQGNGSRTEVIEEFIPHLENRNLHYEQKIAWLEDKYLDRRTLHRDGYRSLLIWMTEMVGHIINIRHAKNLDYIADGCELYRGLASMVGVESPMWIFSLNHDCCVEALSVALDIPLRDGFSDSYVTFPLTDGTRAQFARLPMGTLKERLMFAGEGERAINLLKLHGSIDTFRYDDAKDWLKFRPQGRSAVEALREISSVEDLLLKDPQLSKVLGEIPCLDDCGEVQFLRRTLLSGGHKFQGAIDQNAPMEVLGIMRDALALDVGTLVLIGYSGGDAHINKELRMWMDSDDGRRLVVVDPYKDAVPAVLDQWPGRVELRKERTTDFLSRVGGVPRTPEQETRRKFCAYRRKRKEAGESTAMDAEFRAFMTGELVRSGVEVLLALPLDAPPPTDEEAQRMVSEGFAARVPTPEELMRRFVDKYAETGT